MLTASDNLEIITARDESPFASSGEHMRAELAWLDLIFKLEIRRSMVRHGKAAPVDDFAGLYVSEEEVRQYVEDESPGQTQNVADSATRALEERISAARDQINRRVQLSMQAGVDLRVPQLAHRFGLSATEVQILLICLAPDLDIRCHRCLAYLQNDVGKKRPSVQFLARLSDGIDDVIDARVVLGPDAPLRRHRLLSVTRTPGHDIPFPIQQPTVSVSVADFLVGLDRLDSRLAPSAELAESRVMETYGAYTRHHEKVRRDLLRHHALHGAIPLAYISGPPGSQRSRLVEWTATSMGCRVLRVQLRALLGSVEQNDEILELLARDARLHRAVVHLEDVDELVGEEGRAHASSAAVRSMLKRQRLEGIILTGTRSRSEISAALGLELSGFDLPYPSMEERSEIWSDLLQGAPGEESRLLIDGLASKFKFTPGQIHSVVRTVTALADRAEGRSPVVRIDDLHRSCRDASIQRLSAFARKISPNYRWEDIVLPAETYNQLQEICACVKHRRTVYGSWGFEAKLSLGKGLCVLFAGPSGTGKTMSAEIIASDLELDLYKIDLSGVVSKYVGETERNLERIFNEAESSNSILFFDEADALFGKRSEVKDAHDRYANIEINYLLQKMDDYEGTVILATNLKGNLDGAFMRRLAYVVDFPAPDEELRRRIWENVFPRDVPTQSDIDFGFLARKFQLCGGNIKNIALNSAFMAATARTSVSMTHLVLATKREFHKLGKLCSKSDFGPYLNLIREEA